MNQQGQEKKWFDLRNMYNRMRGRKPDSEYRREAQDNLKKNSDSNDYVSANSKMFDVINSPATILKPKKPEGSNEFAGESMVRARERVRDENINFGATSQDCKRVISIPQGNHSKICWFNALLMVFFYSQHMRSMMMQKSVLWVVQNPDKDKSSRARHELYSIFTDILFSMYDYDTEITREKIYLKFEQISPEKILFILNDIDPDLFPFDPSQDVGFNAIRYIDAICNILYVRVIFMISEPDGNSGKDVMYVKNFVDRKWFLVSEIIDLNKEALEGADIVLVDNLKSFPDHNREEIFEKTAKLSNLNNDIKQFKADLRTNKIRVGDTEYVKDAVFLTNITENESVQCTNHEIAGITCNDRGYIYNGWILKRTNKYITGERERGRAYMGRPSLPCELMPFDWQTNKDVRFSLNKDRCELKVDRGGARDLHFNMVNGTRNLVYVNKKYINKGKPGSSLSKNSVSNDGSKEALSSTPYMRRSQLPARDIDNETFKSGPNETAEKRSLPLQPFSRANDTKNSAQSKLKARKDLLKRHKFSSTALQCIRQVSNMSKLEPSYKFDSASFNPATLLRDLPIVSPKLSLLLENIATLDEYDMKRSNHKFKHVIFSDVKQGFGAKVVASALIANGMQMAYTSGLKMKDLAKTGKDNTDNIALLTGSSLYGGKAFPVTLRKNILETFNKRPDNVYGKNIRFIIIDSSYREGIDLYDVRYMHLFEPQLSETEEKQAIGRGTRYCGQAGLRFDTSLGWPFYVKVYDSLLPEELRIKEENINTLHELYVKNSGIDLKKEFFAKEINKLVIMGSIDYKLNKNYHTFQPIGQQGEEKNERSDSFFPPDGLTLIQNNEQEGGRREEDNNMDNQYDKKEGKEKKGKKSLRSLSSSCSDKCSDIRNFEKLFLVYLSSIPLKSPTELFDGIAMEELKKLDKKQWMAVLCEEIKKGNTDICKKIPKYFENESLYVALFQRDIQKGINKYEVFLKTYANKLLQDVQALFESFMSAHSQKPPSSTTNQKSSTYPPASSSRKVNHSTLAPTGTTPTSDNRNTEALADSMDIKNKKRVKESKKTKKSGRTANTENTKNTKNTEDAENTENTKNTVISGDDRVKILMNDFENDRRLSMARYDDFEIKKPLRGKESFGRFIAFRQFVLDNYSQYAWKDLEFKNMCGAEKVMKFPPKVQALMDKDPVFKKRMTHPQLPIFTPTQEFIRHYFTPSLDIKGIILNHSPGSGKCHAFNTPILMSDGTVKMVQDIKEGDMLMGDDYTPRPVFSLARGTDEMFEVKQENPDAESYGVNQEHILCLICSDQKRRSELSDIGINPTGDGDVYEMEVRHFLRIERHLQESLYGYKRVLAQANVETHPETGKRVSSPTCYPTYPRSFKTIQTPISLTHLGKGDYYGFTIGGNGRYLLRDCTVTHNTCTAISTATSAFEKSGYKIIWVTRKDLKDDVSKNIFGNVICHSGIQQKIKDGILERIPPESDKRGRAKLLGEAWPFEPISYLQFSNLLSKGNMYLRKLEEINGQQDPLKKTLIIIDEAHKLYGETKDLTGERHNMMALEKGIMRSYEKSGKDSVRLILMTATPFTNEPMDMIKLLNLCKIEKEALPTDKDVFANAYLDERGMFTKKGSVRFLNDIAGHISYLNRQFDAREYAQPVIEHVHANMSLSTMIKMKNSIMKSIKYLLSDKEVRDAKVNEKKSAVVELRRNVAGSKGQEKEELKKELRTAQMELDNAKQQLASLDKKIRESARLLKPTRKGASQNEQDKSQESVLFERCMKYKGK